MMSRKGSISESYKMRNGFDIPVPMKNDLIYCKRAVESHIYIHQKLVVAAAEGQTASQPQQVRKSLMDMEKLIMEIGEEQKLLFNRLRFSMDYHLLSRNADIEERIALTNAIREELMEYDRTHAEDIHPKEVQRRLDVNRLYSKYVLRDEIDDDSDSVDVDQTPIDYKIQAPSTSRSICEPMNRAADTVKPMIKIMQKNVQTKEGVKSGQSLLKPRPQWSQVKGQATYGKLPTVEPEKPAAAPIQAGRLKLTQALNKAKDKGTTPATTPQSSTSPSPTEQPKAKSRKSRESPDSMSSSQSSNASSEEVDSIDKNLALNTTVDVEDMTQEEFLRIFRLYTPEYSEYLKNRKPQRRRRNCTTMSARADFHYGKFELFEKQYANKRNKRPFLYSPPATRAKKRVVSNGDKPATGAATATVPAKTVLVKDLIAAKRAKNGIKSNASSSSSLTSNASNGMGKQTVSVSAAAAASATAAAAVAAAAAKDTKVCLKCYKRNNLIACMKCDGRYHSYCHAADIESHIRRTVCPDCCRPKLNVVESKRTYITAGK